MPFEFLQYYSRDLKANVAFSAVEPLPRLLPPSYNQLNSISINFQIKVGTMKIKLGSIFNKHLFNLMLQSLKESPKTVQLMKTVRRMQV